MHDYVFAKFSRYLHERAGIRLTDNEKIRVLMSTRLEKLLPRLGVASHAELWALLRRGDAHTHTAFIDALKTNTTHCWRESCHFELFARGGPALTQAKRDAGGSDLRVWCAASSSGEEPYTLAMLLLEAGGALRGLTPRVLATDIDTEILARALVDVYSAETAEALPDELRVRYLVRGRGDCAGRVWVARAVRELVTLAPFNLIAPGNFHVELARSRAVYFVRLQQDPFEHGVRPAADPLFRSVARVAGRNAVGVVLTGMGKDGAAGLVRMKQAGARAFAQDERTSVVCDMPREAFEIGAVDQVARPLNLPALLVAEFRRRDVA